MKKKIALLMAVLMISVLTACGSGDNTSAGTNAGTSASSNQSAEQNKVSGKLTVEAVKNAPACDENDFTVGQESIGSYTGSAEIVVVPETIKGETIKVVKQYCFANRTTDKAIRFPDTIESFEYCACALNEGVEIVVMGKNTKTIGESAFLRCASLREVIFNEGLETISDLTFSECKNIKSVYIPESVTHIGDGAFFNIKGLEIHGKAGSAAEQYANNEGFTFVAE